MTKDVSRRKMLSLLGFGAALGFTLSAAVEPLEAEAQTVAQAGPPPRPPRPLRPAPEHAGGTGGHRDAPLVISDGPRATVTLLRQLQRHQLHHRNSDLRPAFKNACSAPNKKDEGSLCFPRPRVCSKNKVTYRLQSPAIYEAPLSACPHARWTRRLATA